MSNATQVTPRKNGTPEERRAWERERKARQRARKIMEKLPVEDVLSAPPVKCDPSRCKANAQGRVIHDCETFPISDAARMYLVNFSNFLVREGEGARNSRNAMREYMEHM